MAKRCEICGKKVVHGHRKIHKHSKGWRYRAPKTNRVWVPNLRDITVEYEGTQLEVRVCMACYRRYQKDGYAYVKKKSKRVWRRLLKAAGAI